MCYTVGATYPTDIGDDMKRFAHITLRDVNGVRLSSTVFILPASEIAVPGLRVTQMREGQLAKTTVLVPLDPKHPADLFTLDIDFTTTAP